MERIKGISDMLLLRLSDYVMRSFQQDSASRIYFFLQGLAERHLKPPPLPPVGIKAYQLRVSPPPPPYLPLPPRLSTLSPDHI
ncbi:hypothetical protein F2Q69_00035213 [Brassica cretica]|uniref:Uncharacterized protein n=1 Tax=Brassica cretica TaxID=69181 RepID=A0A8S9SRH8_BRACR|nr:hypothetical protein F2Q69_00035213 [Brassica cretica]